MNYHVYVLSFRERLIYSCAYFFITIIISLLFYNSYTATLIFVPGITIFYKYMRNMLKEKRDSLLTLEFRDFISTVSSSLSAGYSLENAIVQSKDEIYSIYGNSHMYKEIDNMTKKMALQIPIENIFKDFADRCDIPQIKLFSEILLIAKRGGGDLIGIISSTSSSISAQIETRREIETNLAGKKYELYVMSAMPPFIMLYVKFTQPAFFDPVYGNLAGIAIMTICLFVYMAAVYWAYKILKNI